MSNTNTKRTKSSEAGTARKPEPMSIEEGLRILREKGLLKERKSKDSSITAIIGYPIPSATKR